MSFSSVRQYAAENPQKLHWTAEDDYESSVQLTELEMVMIIQLLGTAPTSGPAHAKLLEKLNEKVDQRVSDRRERHERQEQILSDTEVGEELAEQIIADIHSEVRRRRLVFDRMEGKRYTSIGFSIWAIPLGNFNNQNLLRKIGVAYNTSANDQNKAPRITFKRRTWGAVVSRSHLTWELATSSMRGVDNLQDAIKRFAAETARMEAEL
tara:strand:- start:286 stop:912 length:627 start_codon:yes stop_codon:yes gene_type:complete